jgi:hypothetical protein
MSNLSRIVVRGSDETSSYKRPCRAASTAPVNISMTPTVGTTMDDVVLAKGDRVLITDQVAGAQNGIYIVTAGAPVRADDFNYNGNAIPGSLVPIQEGTTNGSTFWVLTTAVPIVLGTTALTFVQYAVSIGGNTVTAIPVGSDEGGTGADLSAAAAGAVPIADGAAAFAVGAAVGTAFGGTGADASTANAGDVLTFDGVTSTYLPVAPATGDFMADGSVSATAAFDMAGNNIDDVGVLQADEIVDPSGTGPQIGLTTSEVTVTSVGTLQVPLAVNGVLGVSVSLQEWRVNNVVKTTLDKDGKIDAPAYIVGGTPGLASFNGAVTNITVVNGIITAAS